MVEILDRKDVPVCCLCSHVSACEMEIDQVVLQRIDKVMKEIFGEKATQAIYDYVERHRSLKRDGIPEKLDVFMRDLEKLLGSGAAVVEKAVLDNLCLNQDSNILSRL